MSVGDESVRVLVEAAGARRTGMVAPGESWYDAAGRLAGAPVHPVDLAGEIKEFTTEPGPQVSLRPMVSGDLPALTDWLAQPDVERWFGVDGEPTPERVRARYAPDLVEGSGTELWVVEAQGRSVGFCQDYLLRDHPDYAVLTPDPDALGVDYALGVPAFVGRGVGTRMLAAWTRHARGRHPGVGTYFAAPDHRNVVSRRLLRKLGFAEGVWFDEAQLDGTVATVVGHSLDVARVLGPA